MKPLQFQTPKTLLLILLILIRIIRKRGSNGTEKLSNRRLGLGIHADDNNQRNKSIVNHHLGLFEEPSGPFFKRFGYFHAAESTLATAS